MNEKQSLESPAGQAPVSKPNPKEGDMDGTTVDPRVVAEALYMETDDLARALTKWAAEALPAIEYDRNWEPTSLEGFDDAVARSRQLLVAAHEAQAAWNEDNPPDKA